MHYRSQEIRVGNSHGIDSPCKGCVAPVRHVGCHGECCKYISYKNSVEANRNKKEAEYAKAHKDYFMRKVFAARDSR